MATHQRQTSTQYPQTKASFSFRSFIKPRVQTTELSFNRVETAPEYTKTEEDYNGHDRSSHLGSLYQVSQLHTDRIPNSETLHARKKSTPVPYFYRNKTKCLFFSPFITNYNEELINQINSNSLYLINDVSPSFLLNDFSKEQAFQLQLNQQKVDRLRETIKTSFDIYYTLHCYTKINLNCSIEMNKVRQLLRVVGNKIETERAFDYQNDGENILLSHCMHQDVYQQNKSLLEPILKEQFIPVLLSFKKKFFETGYFDERKKFLEDALDTLANNINQTMMTVLDLKKKIEFSGVFLEIAKVGAVRIESVKKPQQLCDELIRLMTQIQLLSAEVEVLTSLRGKIAQYLKIVLITSLFEKDQSRLLKLDERLGKCYNILQKKVLSFKKTSVEAIRERNLITEEAESAVNLHNIDLRRIIEEKNLDGKLVFRIRGLTAANEEYVKEIEVLCLKISSEKDEKKIHKTHIECHLHLIQIDQLLRGITFAKETLAHLKIQFEDKHYPKKDPDLVEEEVMKELSSVISQINLCNSALNYAVCSSAMIAGSLDMAFDIHLNTPKWNKDIEKGISWTKGQMIVKMAQIIRKRMQQKNDLFLQSFSRIEQFSTVSDLFEILKSKKLWQAFVSRDSQVVYIKGFIPSANKTITHKIYCNPNIEICILHLIKSIVSTMFGMPQRQISL